MKFEDVHSRGFKSLSPVNEVKKNLSTKLTRMPDESINSISALARIVAKDIVSPVDIPHFTRSAMDGFAVKAENTFGVSQRNPKRLKIIDKIDINEISGKKIQDNEVIQIPTGGSIPEGANAVIKLEDTKKINDEIELYFPIAPFKNISKKGEDLKKGDTIISEGSIIRPQEIAILLAANVLKIKVTKKPRVAIIATGSELIEIGNEPKVGQIIETNTYLLSNLCEVYGASPIRLGIVKDDMNSLKIILEKALEYDIIVFTGGSSVGEHDLLPDFIHETQNSEMLVHGIAMRPGSPTAMAIIQEKPVFCLPGFPVAAMTSFEVFVGFTIRKMLGARELDPRPSVQAILTRQIPSELGRRDYVRVMLIYDEIRGIYLAEPLRTAGSGILSSAVRASGILEIPEESEGLEKDTRVTVKIYVPR